MVGRHESIEKAIGSELLPRLDETATISLEAVKSTDVSGDHVRLFHDTRQHTIGETVTMSLLIVMAL